jgi:hypothetical protein
VEKWLGQLTKDGVSGESGSCTRQKTTRLDGDPGVAMSMVSAILDLERDCKFLHQLNPLPEWNKPWWWPVKRTDRCLWIGAA